jgi:predicted aconitase
MGRSPRPRRAAARHGNDRSLAIIKRLGEKLAEAREEVERLRKALREIADAPCNCEPYQDGQHRHDCQRVSWGAMEARAALEGSHD